jgi:uncharacterized membrane protein YkvA (DUF1232 family)
VLEDELQPMFGLATKLLEQTERLLAAIRYCWRDSRVPLSARLFIALAPFYLAYPFDWRPDYLPGGFGDDAIVVPILLFIALIAIPRVVFQDARKAAALGIVCVGVSGVATCSQALDYESAPSSSPQISTPCPAVAHRHVVARVIRAQADHAIRANEPCRERRPSAAVVSDYFQFVGSDVGRQLITMLRFDARDSVRGPNAFLIIHGGQHQLYASEDDSAAAVAEAHSSSLKMPPRLAGGNFVASNIKELRPGRETC